MTIGTLILGSAALLLTAYCLTACLRLRTATEFVIAAFTAGLGGALFAHLNRYLNPNDFTLAESINILVMIVVGGLRSLGGAVAGAVILVFASEYLRAFKEYRLIIFGALLVLFMALGAEGLRGLPGKVLAGVRRWTRPATGPAARELGDG